MNPIRQAVQSGYSPQQIFRFVSQLPGMSKRIGSALSSGYGANQILQFLSMNIDDLEDTAPTHASTRDKLKQEKRRQFAKKSVKTAATIAATAAAAYAMAPRAAQAGTQLLPALGGGSPPPPNAPPTINVNPIGQQRGLPAPVAPGPNVGPRPGPSSKPTQPSSGQSMPMSPSHVPASAALTPQAQQIDSVDILNDLGVTNQVSNMIKNGSNSRDIADILPIMNKGLSKTLKDNGIKDLSPIIEDFASKIQQSPQTQTQPNLSPERAETPQSIAQEPIREKPKPISTTVITPQGKIATLENEDNGISHVNVDGQKKAYKSDAIIPMDESEEDLAALFDDVVSGIERNTGNQVSRNVYVAGYDPINNELAYTTYDGVTYVYDNISPEDVGTLTAFLAERKSSGGNFIGAWDKGSKSPIGAAMSQLIQKLQRERGGKGKEYTNKFHTIYDALEPAKKAAKEKRAEEKRKTKKSKAT